MSRTNTTQDLMEIYGRIRKRNFKGYEGIAIKNSILQFSTSLVAKGGALIFTIILARILMPELFGLYSLALATILLFASFADLGLNQTLIKFVSNFVGKKKFKKAKDYTAYLFKIRRWSILIICLILIASSRFIAANYYQKPLFLALIAGVLYILFASLVSFTLSIFQAFNNFKYPLFREIFFQISRLIIVPVVILFILKASLSNELILFFIMLVLSLVYLLNLVFSIWLMKRKKNFLEKEKSSKLSLKEKRKIKKFILPLSITVFSGIFFGYIDMLMLGRFVSGEYLGFYQVAFSLITSASAIIAFAVVFFPIFSRLKGKKLEIAFSKSVRINSLISLLAIIFTILLASFIINIIFGNEYSSSTLLLRVLSPLLLSFPLIALYSSYFISQGKPKVVAKLLIFSTLVNIILNYIAIMTLLNYGSYAVVLGVSISTVISRYLYLGSLIIWKKRKS